MADRKSTEFASEPLRLGPDQDFAVEDAEALFERLAREAGPADLPRLLSALEHPSPNVRASALAGLGRIGTPDLLDRLEAMVCEYDWLAECRTDAHIQIRATAALQEGVSGFEAWRVANPHTVPMLRSAQLSNRDLTGICLRGVQAGVIDLEGAILVGADLSGAHLWGARMDRANLRHANLRKASLYNASLVSAALVGADLTDADLENCRLDGADLSGAKGVSSEQLRTAVTSPETLLPEGLQR